MYEAACQYYQVDWVRESVLSKHTAFLISNSSGMQVFSFLDVFILLIIATAHPIDAQVRELDHIVRCDSYCLVLGPRPEFVDSISLGIYIVF